MKFWIGPAIFAVGITVAAATLVLDDQSSLRGSILFFGGCVVAFVGGVVFISTT